MKPTLARLLLAGSLPVFTSATLAATNDEILERMQQLEGELKSLKDELAKKETEQHSKGVEVKKGTRFSYGGFVKFDGIWSDYNEGSRATSSVGDDIFVPSTIPIGGENGKAKFDSHAKTSRFFFKTHTDLGDAGVIKTHFEMDYLTTAGDERVSNSANSRMRHAYALWEYSPNSSLLFGQTWSTFFNAAALPETVDFIGPVAGTIFNRQSQIRWTTKALGGAVSVSMENPSSGLYDGGAGFDSNNFDDNKMPDFALRYDGTLGDLSYSVAGIVREIAYENTATDQDDSTMGAGVNLTGVWKLGKDDLKFSIAHGTLGRYLALNAFRDGVIDADGDIELITQTGGYIAYRHWWNTQWRSTLSYAVSEADNEDSSGPAVNKSVSNASINLFYSPTPALSFGGEFILADRELENGDDGKLERLQFTAKYAF